jgi:bifunctional non-homologous end joining protein LigD
VHTEEPSGQAETPCSPRRNRVGCSFNHLVGAGEQRRWQFESERTDLPGLARHAHTNSYQKTRRLAGFLAGALVISFMLQRTLPTGFVAPCLPTKTDKLPSGGQWLHEIKHDGFRVIARKRGAQVKLYSRPGNDLTYRFPLIVETLARLRSRSCIIDGEAVACDDNGVTSFNRVRYRQHDESIFLYAFDLIELNGDDLRRDPLEGRKATLEMILTKAGAGVRFNEHMEGDGVIVFRHACKLGLEGIVSKRKDSAYRSGRSPDWLKMKNADAPAVKREEEEDWGKERWR